MINKRYDSLVLELTSFVQKYKELDEIRKNAEFDLKWRLTELYKEVEESYEQKFINIAGMQGHLTTSKQKREIRDKEKKVNIDQHIFEELSDLTQIDKKTSSERWAKNLYRRSVRRCHPDTLKLADSEYREELSDLYKRITESYENNNLDILMIESYKLFIKPKKVTGNQLEILEESKKNYHQRIKNILASQSYIWATFNDKMKENFLINLMKQHGVKFVDRSKVKEVLKRKISSRKMGQRPKNKLRDRVKNKK